MFGLPDTQSFLDKFGLHIDLFRYLLIGGLIFTRLFIMAMLTPFLGGKPIPGRVRIAICVALLLFLYPPVSAMSPDMIPTSTAFLFTLFLKEIFFGMVLGLSVAMVFYGVQGAGNMIDNQRQLANARIFNPALGSQSSLFGVFYYQFALVIFLSLGGHRMFLEAVGKSFISVPVLTFPNITPGIDPMLDLIIHLTADTLIITLQLSAPVLVAIFLADLILGLTNRVAPMINVFEMGFNIKGFLGVALVYLSLPLVLFQMKEWFKYTLDLTQKVIEFFLK
jgi:type III secretion protein SpaR/YscT/HrcT